MLINYNHTYYDVRMLRIFNVSKFEKSLIISSVYGLYTSDTLDAHFFQIISRAGHAHKLFQQTNLTVWLKHFWYDLVPKLCHTKKNILTQPLEFQHPNPVCELSEHLISNEASVFYPRCRSTVRLLNTCLSLCENTGSMYLIGVSGHLFYYYAACQN